MKRGLLLVAQSGIVTSLDWWSQLKVSGEAVILQGVHDGDPVKVLTVATLGAVGDAQGLFAAINGRIREGAKSFDVRTWSVPAKPKPKRGLGLTKEHAERMHREAPQTMKILSKPSPPLVTPR